jgi:hypothetical protein
LITKLKNNKPSPYFIILILNTLFGGSGISIVLGTVTVVTPPVPGLVGSVLSSVTGSPSRVVPEAVLLYFSLSAYIKSNLRYYSC